MEHDWTIVGAGNNKNDVPQVGAVRGLRRDASHVALGGVRSLPWPVSVPGVGGEYRPPTASRRHHGSSARAEARASGLSSGSG